MLKPGSPNWTRLNARSLFVCEDREIVSSLRTGKSCFVSYLRKIVTPRPGNRFVSSLRAGKSFRFVSFRFIMEGDLDRCSKHDRCVMDLFFVYIIAHSHTSSTSILARVWQVSATLFSFVLGRLPPFTATTLEHDGWQSMQHRQARHD